MPPASSVVGNWKTHQKFKLLSALAIISIGIAMSINKGSIVPLVISIVALFFL